MKTLTASEIEEIRNDIEGTDWMWISMVYSLSDEFIREFSNNVDWNQISSMQFLSEDIIREFQDKVDWKKISYSQKLSEKFIREFYHKVDWLVLLGSKRISEELFSEFREFASVPPFGYKILKNDTEEKEKGIISGSVEYISEDAKSKVILYGMDITIFGDKITLEELNKMKKSCKFLPSNQKEIILETYSIKLEGDDPIRLLSNIIEFYIYERELSSRCDALLKEGNELIIEGLMSAPTTTPRLN